MSCKRAATSSRSTDSSAIARQRPLLLLLLLLEYARQRWEGTRCVIKLSAEVMLEV